MQERGTVGGGAPLPPPPQADSGQTQTGPLAEERGKMGQNCSLHPSTSQAADGRSVSESLRKFCGGYRWGRSTHSPYPANKPGSGRSCWPSSIGQEDRRKGGVQTLLPRQQARLLTVIQCLRNFHIFTQLIFAN
jgi:hypothetical protein